MNVDTQEVNIVLDKDNTEVHIDIASSGNNVEKLTENVEVKIQTEKTEHIEKPLDSGMNIGSIDASTEKPTEIETEILTTDNIEKPIEKPTEAQVHTETVKLVITEKPKPLIAKMETQTNPPEVDTSKLVTNTGSTKIIKKVDKGKAKVGSVPNIMVKDNLPPLAQIDSQLEEKAKEMTRDGINLESTILFTMNVDTQDLNIVLDKETTEVKRVEATNIEISTSSINIVDSQQNTKEMIEVKKPETIPNDTQLNTEIMAEAQEEAVAEKGHEQSVAEPIVSKVDSKDENKVEK
ncbi:uncharacterized protein LOC131874257 [Cryptomeria japonica]|uniref:uncharacterized protein LOC131874257 n=1 Tax=Cryptomeria japonica TaxID=3369 RepID=UPI0027DA2F1C|nr:uncharacterized protein LOC131874257 [Cryptomeria japonica]